jgi:hypothetical protein
MRVWYFDIPPGTYTTDQIIEMSVPKQTYHCIYQTFRRLKVESFKDKTLTKNQRKWRWLGAEYYLKIDPFHKKKAIADEK